MEPGLLCEFSVGDNKFAIINLPKFTKVLEISQNSIKWFDGKRSNITKISKDYFAVGMLTELSRSYCKDLVDIHPHSSRYEDEVGFVPLYLNYSIQPIKAKGSEFENGVEDEKLSFRTMLETKFNIKWSPTYLLVKLNKQI